MLKRLHLLRRRQRAPDSHAEIHDAFARAFAPEAESYVAISSLKADINKHVHHAQRAIQRLVAQVRSLEESMSNFGDYLSMVSREVDNIVASRSEREKARERVIGAKIMDRFLDAGVNSDSGAMMHRLQRRERVRRLVKTTITPARDPALELLRMQSHVVELGMLVFDNMIDLLLLDMSVFSVDRRLERLRLLERRQLALTLYFQSSHAIGNTVHNRNVYYNRLQELTRVWYRSHLAVVWGMRDLALIGDMSGYFASEAERWYSYGLAVRTAGHNWRTFLKMTMTSIFAPVTMVDDPVAWDHERIGRQSRALFMNVAKGIETIQDQLQAIAADLRALPSGDDFKVRFQRQLKNMMRLRWNMNGLFDEMFMFSHLATKISLRRFYLKLDEDDIYWNQIDILAPFQRVHVGFFKIRYLTRVIFQGGVQNQFSPLVDYYVEAEKYWRSYTRLYETFVELNWARLKLSQRFPELYDLMMQPLLAPASVLPQKPTLNIRHARFRDWAAHILDATAPISPRQRLSLELWENFDDPIAVQRITKEIKELERERTRLRIARVSGNRSSSVSVEAGNGKDALPEIEAPMGGIMELETEAEVRAGIEGEASRT